MTIKAVDGKVVITLSVKEAEQTEIDFGSNELTLPLDDPLGDWQAFGAAVADAKAAHAQKTQEA